jgi:hypothetical protein
MLTIWIFMGRVMQSKHHFRICRKVEDKSQLFITKDLPLTGVTVAVDAVYSAFNVRIKMEVIYSI